MSVSVGAARLGSVILGSLPVGERVGIAFSGGLDTCCALAWMRAVNDVRLLLGTRLGVGEDPSERQVALDDPRAPGFALYDYLSLLTQELVEALES